MSIFSTIKDHILIGGPNALSGWGLLLLLVFSSGVRYGQLLPGLDVALFLTVLAATALTGNGIYALNAYYDRGADAVNKSNRPVPAGRMTPAHALKYAYGLMGLGLAVSVVVTVWTGNSFAVFLWMIFTLLGIAYSRPPFNLKGRHIWGNLCFGIFTVLCFLISSIIWNSAVQISWLIYIVIFAVYVAGLITMKDFSDYEGDKANGDITMPVKFGRRGAAVLSIVLMAIPTAYFTYMSPPSSLESWVSSNWGFLILVGSFAVYIALDSIRQDHVVSDAYSKVIYYYVILLTAYGFLKYPLLPLNLILLINPWERYAELAIYITVAVIVVIRSWKTQPTIQPQPLSP